MSWTLDVDRLAMAIHRSGSAVEFHQDDHGDDPDETDRRDAEAIAEAYEGLGEPFVHPVLGAFDISRAPSVSVGPLLRLGDTLVVSRISLTDQGTEYTLETRGSRQGMGTTEGEATCYRTRAV